MTVTKFSDFLNGSVNEATKKQKPIDIEDATAGEFLALMQNKKANFGNFYVYSVKFNTEKDVFVVTFTCALEDLKQIIEGYNYGRDKWIVYLDKDGSLAGSEVTFTGTPYIPIRDNFNTSIYGIEMDSKGVRALYDAHMSFIEIAKSAEKIGKKLAKKPEWQALFK